MKEIIDALKAAMANLKEKSNAALVKLGPIDQIQASQEVVWALNSMNYSVTEIEGMLTKVAEIDAKFPAEVAAQIAAKIASGDLIDKATHVSLVTAAKIEGETDVRTQIAAQAAAATKIATRRSDLAALSSVAAAAAIADDLLSADDIAPLTAEVTRRSVALKAIGLDPVARADEFVSLLSCQAFDEAGAKGFDASLQTIRVAAGLKEGQTLPAVPGRVAASTVPPVTPGGATPPVEAAPKSSARSCAF